MPASSSNSSGSQKSSGSKKPSASKDPSKGVSRESTPSSSKAPSGSKKPSVPKSQSDLQAPSRSGTSSSSGSQKENKISEKKELSSSSQAGKQVILHSMTGFYKWNEQTWQKVKLENKIVLSSRPGGTFFEKDLALLMDMLKDDINQFEHDVDHQYMVINFEGKKDTTRIPRYDPQREHLEIFPTTPLQLSKYISPDGGLMAGSSPPEPCYYVKPVRGVKHANMKECAMWKYQYVWSYWIDQWRTGKWSFYATRMKDLIHKYKDQMKDIDRILCFNLGALRTVIERRDENPEDTLYDEQPRPFILHMLAATIRDTIYEILDKDRKPDQLRKTIQIHAQDQSYCDKCKEILQKHLKIEATEGFSPLYLSDNQNEKTLVFAGARSTQHSTVSIICDITSSFGGPTAMLCPEIEMHERSWNGANIKDKPWLRWDGWNGKELGEAKRSPYWDEQTTKNMAKYVKSCDSEYFGDFTRKMGFPMKDFTKTILGVESKREEAASKLHPDSPDAKTPSGPEGDRMYREAYGSEYQTDIAEANRLAQKWQHSWFGDLQLYVKNPEKKPT